MTVRELVDLVEKDYARRRCVYLKNFRSQIKPLLRHLGGMKAVEITTRDIEAYKDARLSEKAAHATVNNELSAIRRGFTLGIRQDYLEQAPRIEALPVDNVREGFCEPADYRRLVKTLGVLDEVVSDIIRVMYSTGWRSREVKALQWKEINLETSMIRLPGRRSKNRTARAFAMPEELRSVFARRWEKRFVSGRNGPRQVPWVFHRSGAPVKSFRGIWHRAVRAIGLPGLRPHDLRRSFATNALNSGVPETIIMQLGGWKTASVFRRYCIVNERELRTAAERVERFIKEA